MGATSLSFWDPFTQYLNPAMTAFGWLSSVLGIPVAIIQMVLWNRQRQTLTWKASLATAELLLRSIEQSGWKPDVVVGLGRSGALWGGWIAGNLGSLPIAVIDLDYRKADVPGERFGVVEAAREEFRRINARFKNITSQGTLKVLVVEGASSTGDTFRDFRRACEAYSGAWEVKYAVLFKNRGNRFQIDFVGNVGLSPWPEKMPWQSRAVWRTHM